MKHKARTVAAGLRSRARPRTRDDERPAESRRPAATGQEPVIRILPSAGDQGFYEVLPDQPASQQSYPDDTPKDTALLYLLGIAAALYLFALLFILFW